MRKDNQFNLSIDIYDFKEGEISIDESQYTIHHVNEIADGNEMFGNFLKFIARKYNSYKHLLFRLLNGNELIWKEYFSEEIIDHLFINNEHDDYLYGLADLGSIKISDLVINFKIDKKTIRLGINGPDLGAEVGSCEGISFIIHTRETSRHHLKHIHCVYSGEEVEINLETCEFIGDQFKNHKKSRRALKIVQINQGQLINYWDEVVVKGHPAPELNLLY